MLRAAGGEGEDGEKVAALALPVVLSVGEAPAEEELDLAHLTDLHAEHEDLALAVPARSAATSSSRCATAGSSPPPASRRRALAHAHRLLGRRRRAPGVRPPRGHRRRRRGRGPNLGYANYVFDVEGHAAGQKRERFLTFVETLLIARLHDADLKLMVAHARWSTIAPADELNALGVDYIGSMDHRLLPTVPRPLPARAD